ncbi:MAG: outer membrane beta-barrel family protein, partial [Ferruginibacter sp.]
SIKDKIAFLTQNNAPQTQGTIVYGRAGMDYFADNRNTFSLTGNLVRGKFRNRDYLYTSRDTTYPTFTSHETSERDLRSITYFTNSGFVTGYRHNFSRPNRDITADVTYNQTNNTNTSDYQSYYFDMAGIALPPVGAERATGGGKTKFLTIQSDYATPFSKNKRLETGLRMSRRNFISYNDNFIQDLTSRRYVYIPAIAVAYNFNDQVYAAYANYAQQFKTFSLQAGLRVENSRYDGRLVSGKSFSNSYPFSLFPSLYLSKKLSEHQNLQLNYSRKINRPGFFQIIPFIDFSDSLNLTIGFPGLKPEFIHLGELSYVYQNLQGNTFQGTIYGKRSDDIILRYQYRAANPNPAKLDSVIFNSYANARESNTMGIELTNRTKVMNWWDLTTSFNLYHIDVNADNLAGAGNTTLTSYFGKIASTFRLGNNFTLQLNSEYQAKTILPVNAGRNATTASYGGSIFGSSQVSAQGYIKPLFSTDISLKKEFGKNNAAALTLQFNDVLRTRLYSTHANGSYFSQDYSRRRDPQYARLNFNYRFGKPDGSIFKRRNQRADMEPVQGIPQ